MTLTTKSQNSYRVGIGTLAHRLYSALFSVWSSSKTSCRLEIHIMNTLWSLMKNQGKAVPASQDKCWCQFGLESHSIFYFYKTIICIENFTAYSKQNKIPSSCRNSKTNKQWCMWLGSPAPVLVPAFLLLPALHHPSMPFPFQLLQIHGKPKTSLWILGMLQEPVPESCSQPLPA